MGLALFFTLRSLDWMLNGLTYLRMAYIEEGIKKKRGEQGIKDDDEPVEDAPYDPHDELYQIDERYRLEKKIADEEGNVTNSMAMLTAIPEVDLGME